MQDPEILRTAVLPNGHEIPMTCVQALEDGLLHKDFLSSSLTRVEVVDNIIREYRKHQRAEALARKRRVEDG